MSRGDRGQAVMLAMMGAMLVAGLVVWLATGEFHMMPGHGKKDSHAESRHVPSVPRDFGHGDSPRPEADPDSAAVPEAGDADEAAGKNR